MLELKLHLWFLKLAVLLNVWAVQYGLCVPLTAIWQATKALVVPSAEMPGKELLTPWGLDWLDPRRRKEPRT